MTHYKVAITEHSQAKARGVGALILHPLLLQLHQSAGLSGSTPPRHFRFYNTGLLPARPGSAARMQSNLRNHRGFFLPSPGTPRRRRLQGPCYGRNTPYKRAPPFSACAHPTFVTSRVDEVVARVDAEMRAQAVTAAIASSAEAKSMLGTGLDVVMGEGNLVR